MSIPSWAQDLGAVSSIIGLLVTLWLLYHARRLALSFLVTARVPEAKQRLTAIARELSAELGNWPEARPEVLVQLAKSKAVTLNITPRLSGAGKVSGKHLSKRLKRATNQLNKRSEGDGADLLWELYADIQEFVEALNQIEKDSRWEKK